MGGFIFLEGGMGELIYFGGGGAWQGSFILEGGMGRLICFGRMYFGRRAEEGSFTFFTGHGGSFILEGGMGGFI